MNKKRKEAIERAIQMAMSVISRPDKETYVGGLAIRFEKKITSGKTDTYIPIRTARSRGDTKITSIFFDLGTRYSHADAFTNNGIGIYTTTRRSNRDIHSPELALRVLAGKLYHALEAYQEGESLKNVGIRFAAIIPVDSMGIWNDEDTDVPLKLRKLQIGALA